MEARRGRGAARASTHRDNRDALLDARLVLISLYDPAARFVAGHAMEPKPLRLQPRRCIASGRGGSRAGRYVGWCDRATRPAFSFAGLCAVDLRSIRRARRTGNPRCSLVAESPWPRGVRSGSRSRRGRDSTACASSAEQRRGGCRQTPAYAQAGAALAEATCRGGCLGEERATRALCRAVGRSPRRSRPLGAQELSLGGSD